MIIFMAGNFPLMGNIEEERAMKDRVFSYERDYNRLLSFFYPKGACNVLQIKEEVENETIRK